MTPYTPNKRYPCPHDRELTDQELDVIADQGRKDYKRENKGKKPTEGDEWKE